jgi:CheY-like chemotaxis protein
MAIQKQILVVEDDAAIALIVSEALRDEAAHIVVAGTIFLSPTSCCPTVTVSTACRRRSAQRACR